MHFVNIWIFSRSAGKGKNNGVWKSEYGDVFFTKHGEGTPVLLVHGIGIGGGSSDWDGNIKALSKNHTVYTIDLPGFGSSEKRKMTYSSYYYAKVINDFILKIIGQKASVVSSDISCGFVLAGACLCPKLYNKIIAVNPYAEGMGAMYKSNGFVKAALPFPVFGTSVYSFISSRQSILSFMDAAVPSTENFVDITALLEAKYENAHLAGSNNKYAIISFINGYLDSNIFSLIKKCPVTLCVVVSGGITPLVPVYEGVSVTEIKEGRFYPNIYAADEFNGFVDKFIKRRAIV